MSYGRLEEKRGVCRDTCQNTMNTLFVAFQGVFGLVRGFHDRNALEGMLMRSIDANICKRCICAKLDEKVMKAWVAREKNERKLYVGFIRREGSVVKAKPFVRISPCVSEPETPLQNQFMFDWVSEHSNTFLDHLRENYPKLSWKWEKRGFNKLIIRIKPTLR
jgi:hypothetical protein